MSKKHPIIVVTGSSGAGTTFVKRAFESIFKKENINPLIVEGDSFHKYDRIGMKKMVQEQEIKGNHFFLILVQMLINLIKLNKLLRNTVLLEHVNVVIIYILMTKHLNTIQGWA